MSTPTTALQAQLEDMERRKDGAYEERNRVVAALAKCFPSGVARTAIEGWSEDWHGCVYIDLPTGQVSWHFHDSQAHLFAGLPAYTKPWDGHDTPEKYRRVAALSAPAQDAPPIDMLLHCPACGMQHIDAPEPHLLGAVDLTTWHNPAHRSHLCHGCGHIWRPADVPTNGVAAVKTKGKADSPIAARASQPTPAQDAAATVPEGMVLAPDYRGYARLGLGMYLLNHSDAGDPAELIVSIVSEEEAAGRTVGDLKDNAPGTVLQPEQMAVRLRFENVAGLDALEQQLRLLRDLHFSGSAPAPKEESNG